MSKTIQIFDPAMCCSTGVCGSDADQQLINFANDLKWLKSQGVLIERFNLGQEPEVFKQNPKVLQKLKSEGSSVLPLILIDDEIVSEAGYPGRNELISWIGLKTAPNAESPDLLASLASAIKVGDVRLMEQLFIESAESGLEMNRIVMTIQEGINERQFITRSIADKANALLGATTGGCTPGGGCC